MAHQNRQLMAHQMDNRCVFSVCYCSEIVFQLQPTPRDSSPTTIDPPPRESISSHFSVVFKSILSRFRVATQSRLNIDSETTEKRPEIDFLGGGVGGVGERIPGVGCSWKTISLCYCVEGPCDAASRITPESKIGLLEMNKTWSRSCLCCPEIPCVA